MLISALDRIRIILTYEQVQFISFWKVFFSEKSFYTLTGGFRPKGIRQVLKAKNTLDELLENHLYFVCVIN